VPATSNGANGDVVLAGGVDKTVTRLVLRVGKEKERDVRGKEDRSTHCGELMDTAKV